jgi:hypothetical protein
VPTIGDFGIGVILGRLRCCGRGRRSSGGNGRRSGDGNGLRHRRRRQRARDADLAFAILDFDFAEPGFGKQLRQFTHRRAVDCHSFGLFAAVVPILILAGGHTGWPPCLQPAALARGDGVGMPARVENRRFRRFFAPAGSRQSAAAASSARM